MTVDRHQIIVRLILRLWYNNVLTTIVYSSRIDRIEGMVISWLAGKML